MSDDDLLDAIEASEFLTQLGDPHTESTLAKKRCVGGGPVYLLIGRRIRYKRHRLREYRDSRTREMTSTSAVTE
jgi:hypothetical protein